MTDEGGRGPMTQRGTIRHDVTVRWRAGRLARLAAVLTVATALSGCGTINEKLAGTLSDMPGIGLPTNSPDRPAEPFAYPAVHDMPPQRSVAALSEVEQQKLEDDLVAARKAQRGSASDKSAAAQKKPLRPGPRVVPVSSSRTIY